MARRAMAENAAMTLALPDRTDILRAIAARADNEHIATLSPVELEFAMTLEGRRLLECIRLGSNEFRLSRLARELLDAPAGGPGPAQGQGQGQGH